MRIEQGFVQGLSSDSTGFSSSGSGKLPVAIPRFERFWLSAMRAGMQGPGRFALGRCHLHLCQCTSKRDGRS